MQTRSDSGSALLMVLWLTAALSAVGLAVASNVRSETDRTKTNIDDARAYFLARGAVERAALHFEWSGYRTPDGAPMYYVNGNPHMDLSFPAGDAHVEIIPEASKLSLNGSRPEEILRLLMALGAPEEQATQVTAAIVDWRTPANEMRASPFDGFYLSQIPSFVARHASFQENEELLLVKGMTPDLYYGNSLDGSRPGLRDCISVYGSAGTVDINTARRPTLEAIGIDPVDADLIIAQRTRQPFLDYMVLRELAESLGPAGRRLQIGGSTMFTLRATARFREPNGKLSDMRRTVSALVKFYLSGNRQGRQDYDVVRWFDRG